MIRKKIDFPNVSFHRFYQGIFLGMLTTIAIYFFFIVCREALRFVFSITEYYDLWTLTKSETWFYNLIFAFISSIFGEGICLKIWYERPKQFFLDPYFNYRRKAIINDVFVLNTNFLNVFTKVALVYGIWFGSTNIYIVYNLNPKFNFIWFLLIIVLHLEQWKAIRLIFKDSSLKGMIIFSGSITILSFTLSFIQPKVFERVNNNYLSKSIDHNYILERPTSYYSKFDYRFYEYIDLYFVYPKNNRDVINPTLILNHSVINFEDLYYNIVEKRGDLPDFLRDRFAVYLHCDKNTKMKYIKDVKTELAKCGIEKISYALIPYNYEYPTKFCRHAGIKDNLSDYDFYCAPEEFEFSYLIKSPYIKIDIIDSDFIKINEVTVHIKDFKKGLIQKMNSDKFKQLQLYANDDVDYQTYIFTRDIINKTVLIWRDQKVYEIYGKPYAKLNTSQSIKFDHDFYFQYFELSDRLNKMINDQ